MMVFVQKNIAKKLQLKELLSHDMFDFFFAIANSCFVSYCFEVERASFLGYSNFGAVTKLQLLPKKFVFGHSFD